MAINTQKVVVGGLAAGVVMAVCDWVVNGILLVEQNAAAMNALNPALLEGLDSPAMAVTFVGLDLLWGIVLIWTYAAMRPRFGPGPRTATIAGVQVWLVAAMVQISLTAMGMWSWSYTAISGIVYLVVMVIAANVGGMLYKEE